MGAAVEGVSRLLRQPQHGSTEGGGFSSSASSSSILVNEANSDRLAESLCRMRGAALKMGQMLSIQDETLMPPALQRALVRVRQGAEAMPRSQLERQMADQLGPDWRDKFATFDDLPFAAASIGQVHRAAIRRPGSSSSSGNELQHVVVKVQYPGVAKSIRSDLRNLSMLVTWTGMAPPGLFIDNVIRVGEQELTVECDYRRELSNQRRIRDLVEADPTLRENRFVVPDAVPELSTDQILTNEFRPGGTIDKVTNLSQDERNRIGRAIMYLTMKELFVWRFMQTDPNWGNFLYDIGTGTTSLIDFGAAREYSKSFVDGYLRIVWASANRDEGALMKQSHRMNFLTGDENEQMLRAHKLSGYTVGEPFFTDEPFDFRGSNISTRMGEHTSVFLRHRLTPPPEEVYTLHRKLAGAYMLCIKLGAVVECRSLLQVIVQNHVFEDGLEPLIA
jgi:aarF domain-containing kinase